MTEQKLAYIVQYQLCKNVLRSAWKDCNNTSTYLWELESLLIFINIFYLQ